MAWVAARATWSWEQPRCVFGGVSPDLGGKRLRCRLVQLPLLLLQMGTRRASRTVKTLGASVESLEKPR